MNKKGDLPGQTVLWIAKILLFLFAIAIILWPVGCYINRSVEDGGVESYVVMKKIISCLEREGFDRDNLGKCMKQDRYGIKISFEDKEIIFNKEKYLERSFCDIGRNYFCKKEIKNINNKEFLIEVVVKSE